MINADYIINSNELNYEPYRQSRGDGFSGQLLLATEKKNLNKKYIIKAAQAHVAACEFMFYVLAEKLGLRTARVWLIAPCKPNEFEYPACAIEFIPNTTKLQYDEYINIKECEILANLSFILGDRDNLDFLRDENGTVYKIDHADCFGIEGTAETWIKPNKNTVEHMFYQLAKPKPNVGHYAKEELMQDTLDKIVGFTTSEFNEELAVIKQSCGAPFEEHFRYYINELIGQCWTPKK